MTVKLVIGRRKVCQGEYFFSGDMNPRDIQNTVSAVLRISSHSKNDYTICTFSPVVIDAFVAEARSQENMTIFEIYNNIFCYNPEKYVDVPITTGMEIARLVHYSVSELYVEGVFCTK